MALQQTLQYPQQDPFNKNLCNNTYNFVTNSVANFEYYENFNFENEEQGSVSTFLNNQTENYPFENWTSNMDQVSPNQSLDSSISTLSRSKKQRVKKSKKKNKEEIENQRMTHIAVERNRRKQMNEYLSVLRSLMPSSFIQRGDQASIIGGAINFVKNLEQRLQFLVVQKQKDDKLDTIIDANKNKPFSEFFTFPQYSTSVCENYETKIGEVQSSNIADIEVTMVESHANLKIRSKKRPKQLLKIVSNLHGMCLTILHLNVTTTSEFVFYSLTLKVEDNCKLGSVDEIAKAVYQMLERIQQESILN